MTGCAVIGGGISGLAAAVRLASRGIRVTLFEAKSHCGGRAFAFTDSISGERLDNGQHIMMGCYTEMLAFLRTIGADTKLVPIRNLRVPFISANGDRATLVAKRLPWPLDALSAFLGFDMLSFAERLALLNVVRAAAMLSRKRLQALDTRSVLEWLTHLRQGPAALARLWEPIVLATMNARPRDASAMLFATVLREAFLGGKAASTFLLPSTDLSALYVDDALSSILRNGGSIQIHTMVESIIPAGSGFIINTNKDAYSIPAIVLALSHRQHERLAAASPEAAIPVPPPGVFVPSEIASVHIWSKRQFTNELMTAFLGTSLQWLFSKGSAADGGWRYSGVISAADSVSNQPIEELERTIARELYAAYPSLAQGELYRMKTVRERFATFIPAPGLNAVRSRFPIANGAIANGAIANGAIAIAGDWTGTSLPATLEGAVRSGHAAADYILGRNFSTK